MRGMSFGLGAIFIEPVLSFKKLKDVLLNQLLSNLDLKSQVKNCSFSAGFTVILCHYLKKYMNS